MFATGITIPPPKEDCKLVGRAGRRIAKSLRRELKHRGGLRSLKPLLWCGYNRVGGHHGRIHVRVDHSGSKSTYAIDADGDGVREVHCNTMEGIWTGLRNFLRPFRGVSKWCMSQYVAMFEWSHNIKAVTDEFHGVMLGIGPNTEFAS